MEFANCKEVAIQVSGEVSGDIYYGLYIPLTDPETWHSSWRSRNIPVFTHFWVEKDNKIVDKAKEQFGETSEISEINDPRYIKVGIYDKGMDKTFPLVKDPQIFWDSLTGVGGLVNVKWNNYNSYMKKLRGMYFGKNDKKQEGVGL